VVAIEAALRDGELEMEWVGDLSDSDVLFKILTPIAGRPTRYAINKLYIEILGSKGAET
jgi:hypothetical protein